MGEHKPTLDGTNRIASWRSIAFAVVLGLAFLAIVGTGLAETISLHHRDVAEVQRSDEKAPSSLVAPLDVTATYTYYCYLPVAFHNYRVPVWQSLGLQEQSVRVIALDSSTSGVLYIGTFDEGIQRSEDSGNSWYQINNGLQSEPGIVAGIGIDSSDPQALYTAVTGYPRFFRSLDAGQYWQSGGDIGRVPQLLSVHPVISGCLFAGGRALPDLPGGEVYKSSDGGLSWQMVITDQVLATAIVASPLTASLVYAGGSGLYRSQDGGDTFIELTAGLPFSNVGDIALHPTDALTAYASTEAGIFKTVDGGDNWSFWGNDAVSRLLIDIHSPKIQYASKACAGVFVSRDEGKHWKPMGTGLGNLCVNDLALDQTSTRLYAATEDGVWVVDLVEGR